MLSRVFSINENSGDGMSAPSAVSSQLNTGDIENYYLKIISGCLQRMLVPLDAIEIHVRRAGTGPRGVAAFAGHVRILKWDPAVTPVLLQNLPVLDERIRKVVRASVILEGTCFAGVWFQAASDMEGSPKALLGVLREAVHQPPGR